MEVSKPEGEDCAHYLKRAYEAGVWDGKFIELIKIVRKGGSVCTMRKKKCSIICRFITGRLENMSFCRETLNGVKKSPHILNIRF